MALASSSLPHPTAATTRGPRTAPFPASSTPQITEEGMNTRVFQDAGERKRGLGLVGPEGVVEPLQLEEELRVVPDEFLHQVEDRELFQVHPGHRTDDGV